MTIRTKKTATATIMAAVAATALVGGSLAAFTDSDTTQAQVLKAGTVEIHLVEGADWNTNLTNLAVGDTAYRTVQVDNTSTLDIGAMRLTADLTDQVGEFGGRLSEAVIVDITQDGSTVLANDVRLGALADGYDLTFPGANLPAGTDVTLGFHYEVVGAPTTQTGDRTRGQRETPANPDNKYQGSGLTVTYTVDALQRAGIDDRPAAAPESVTATVSGTSAVVTFTEPTDNPDGTVYTATAIEETATAAAFTSDPTVSTLTVSADTSGSATLSVASTSRSTSGLASPLTVSGLTAGRTYAFAVTATSPAGATSEPVVSNLVTIPAPTTLAAAWGSNTAKQSTVPAGLTNIEQVSAGRDHTLALRTDGTVTGWGGNGQGQLNIPADLGHVKQVEAGEYISVALKEDGTVRAWGWSSSTRIAVPAGLSNVTQISTGEGATVVLKADGTVTGWGYYWVAPPAGLTDVMSVEASQQVFYAIKSDGTVVKWGERYNTLYSALPAGLTDVKQMATGYIHGVILHKNGTVTAFGTNNYGQTAVPAGLTDVVAVAAGRYHSMALKSDGTLVMWGQNASGQTTVPSGLGPIAQIAGGWDHTAVAYRQG